MEKFVRVDDQITCTDLTETVNRDWIGSSEVGQSAIILLKEEPTHDAYLRESSRANVTARISVDRGLKVVASFDRFHASLVLS